MTNVRVTQRRLRSPPDRRRAFPSTSQLATARRVATELARLVPPPAFLTPREARLLPWLATDLTYAQIAAELGGGVDNLHQLAHRLFQHLGAESRAGVIARWLRPDAFEPPYTQKTAD